MNDKLNSKVTAFFQLTKLANAIGNRIWMYENEEAWRKKRGLPPMHYEAEEKELIKTIFGDLETNWEGLKKKKEVLQRELEAMGKETKIWCNWLRDVKGVGGASAAVIECKLMPKEFPSRSHLQMYLGYGTIQGKAPKKERGKTMNYNHTLRAYFWNIGECLVRSTGKYYEYYLKMKEKYIKKYAEQFKIENKEAKKNMHPKHIDKMARRKMTKLFISHLWEEMYRAKYPDKQVPKPMHFKDVPMRDSEIIKPFRDNNV